MESTELHPVQFLESFLNEESLNLFKEEFYAFYKSEYAKNTFDNVNINKCNECVTIYMSTPNESGVYEPLKEIRYFKKELECKLRTECKKSKKLISDQITKMQIEGGNIPNFLTYQVQKLNYLRSFQSLFDKYPICSKPINSLIAHINKELGITEIDIYNKGLPMTDDTQLKINKIFGDLEKFGYMDETEYKRFEDCIYQFVTTWIIPENISKFEIPKKESKRLPKGWFYYQFHKLYDEFCKRGDMDLVSKFIIVTFIEFKDKKIKNLSSDLSNYANKAPKTLL